MIELIPANKPAAVLPLIAIISLVVLALYLPSQFPAQTFYDHLRAEHAANEAFWGNAHAGEILERALAMDAVIVAAPETVAPAVVKPKEPIAGALGDVRRRLAAMWERFTGSSYVQGLRATLLLAEYRLSSVVQWLPAVLGFVVLALVDGLVVRVVRAYEFGDHSPVRFGAVAVAFVGLAWLVAVSLMWPTAVHPLFYAIVPLVLAALLSALIANFHRSSLRPPSLASA